MAQSILIEGFTLQEIIAFTDAELEAWILVEDPIVFKVGTAEILCKIEIVNQSLVIELAQIDGGGEGVLRTIGSLARRFAQQRDLQNIEWIVHSLDCSKPNPKLNPMLERTGFTIQEVPNKGRAYYRKMPIATE